MHDAAVVGQIKARYRALTGLMDERMRRQWAATEAQTYGWGGMSAVCEATGMSRNTIRKGIAETEERQRRPKMALGSRLRKQGGGRKSLVELDPGLREALEVLVDPVSRGDPMCAALDLQEHDTSGQRTDPARASDQPMDSRQPAQG
jgi:hypothetical protein